MVRRMGMIEGLPQATWEAGDLMVSVLDSRGSALGSSLGRGHCVVSLGKILNSHGAFLHPGV